MTVRFRTARVFQFGLPLLLLSTLSLASPPQKPNTAIAVRFSEPAMPTGRLISELSKRTGVHLSCSSEVADDVVLLEVDSVPLSQIMTRIAGVIDARWRWTGSVWLLERPDEMIRVEREKEDHAQTAKIAAKRQEMFSTLQNPWNSTTLQAALPKINHYLTTGQLDAETEHMRPLWRTFLRCLSDISPEDIAQIPPGGRGVFATSPTSRQRSLGKGAQEALTQYLTEKKTFDTALGKAGKQFSEFDPGGTMFGRSNPITMPARILLIIENKWSDSYECRLLLLDNKNQEVASKSIDNSGFTLSEYTPQAEPPPKSSTVLLSHRSRVLRSMVSRADSSSLSQTAHPSAEAREILCNPERYEPLSMTITDGYLALAKARHRNLIAVLPDRLLKEGLLYSNDSFTLNDVQHWPYYGPQMRIIDHGGWLTVTPPDPYHARLERVDRATLGNICRRVAKAGIATIAEVAELAAHSGNKPMYHFGGDYLWALSGGNYRSGGIGNWTLLSLYGALTDEQRQTLSAGKMVAYGSLTPWQRSFAEMSVYGARYNRSEESTGKEQTKLSGDLWNEPTQYWPEGLPPTAGIRATAKRKTIVYFVDPDKTGEERKFWYMDDTPTLGYSSMGPPPQIPRKGFDVVRYEIHYQSTITVSVDVNPMCRMSAEYKEDIEPASGLPVPLDKLPLDLQKSVKKEIQFVRMLAGFGALRNDKPPQN